VADYSLRFDDPALQARFLSELARKGVPHHISGTGAAECSAPEWGGVNGVAHTIRDSCFPWYFSWFDPESAAQDFLARLRQSELPFQLEHHKDRVVFLLAREYETQYHALLAD
jgi:hypothetical protein